MNLVSRSLRQRALPRLVSLLLSAACLTLAAGAAPAAPIWTNGGTLSACYPGNTTNLSSDGCPDAWTNRRCSGRS